MALDGIFNRRARQMQHAVVTSIAHKHQVDKLISEFGAAMVQVKAWVSDTQRSCTEQLQRRGWLNHEFKGLIAAGKSKGLDALLSVPEISQHLAAADNDTQ